MKFNIFSIVLIAFSALVISCSNNDDLNNETTTGTLVGVITGIQEDQMTGLESAKITVFKNDIEFTTTLSNAKGEYMVEGLDVGGYAVVVEREGYRRTNTPDEIQITAGNKTVQDFELNLDE